MPAQIVLRLAFPWIETEPRLAASIDFTRAAGADRVMLFNARGHAEPAHYDHAEITRRATILGKAMAAFRAAGFPASINNLATVGMNLSPPRKSRLPFQGLVDYDGRFFPECYCPLDPGWLEYVGYLFGAWASLGPDELWIDDDFRYKTGAAQCFCPLHLAELEKRTGRAWTRESLLPALTSEGVLPSELARAWAALQDEALFAAAQRIADAVRAASPAVRLGFMGVNFSVYQYGAAYLRRLGEILSPGRPMLVRPEYGGYSDESRNAWNAYAALWSCRRALGGRFDPWPEGETWPYPRFVHSRKVLRMKLAWGAAHGFTHTTVNVLDFSDTEFLREEPGLGASLVAARRHVGAVARVIEDASLMPEGVSLELPENRIGWRTVPAYTDFGYLGVRTISRLGIPLWPEPGGESPHARIVIGNAPLSRAEALAGWAKRGLLLDRQAFEVLAAMSRDDLLGGARPREMGGFPCVERFGEHTLNGGAAGRVLSLETAPDLRSTLGGFALPESHEFTTPSWFEDQDGARLSAAVWARAWPGGRMAVLPFALHEARSENAFINWKRKSQIEAALEWLSGRPLPVRVEGAADLYTLYRQSPDSRRIVVALANYSHDDTDGADLQAVLAVPALAASGAWRARVLRGDALWLEARTALGEGGRVPLTGALVIPSMEVRLIEFARLD